MSSARGVRIPILVTLLLAALLMVSAGCEPVDRMMQSAQQRLKEKMTNSDSQTSSSSSSRNSKNAQSSSKRTESSDPNDEKASESDSTSDSTSTTSTSDPSKSNDTGDANDADKGEDDAANDEKRQESSTSSRDSTETEEENSSSPETQKETTNPSSDADTDASGDANTGDAAPGGETRESSSSTEDAAESSQETDTSTSVSSEGYEISGDLQTWHRITLSFKGPDVSETAQPNPFLYYRLQVTFSGPSGQEYNVPGFYAADGNAAHSSARSGDRWRVRFSPDEPGEWNFEASFRKGQSVAIRLDPEAGSPAAFDGTRGTLQIAPTDKTGRDFRARGRLEYVGGHYFQFAGNGEFFLKGGHDSPENMLGYVDFDQTKDLGNASPPTPSGLHEFQPHVSDWNPGDPTWKDGKGKGLIGAINYLTGQGVNSLYFLTHNLSGGDGMDSWMWMDPHKRTRYDVSKLAQWEIVFRHMTRRGMQLHVVTQEAENDAGNGLDRGKLGTTRKLYYRELVARFGHHLGVVWNLGEENSNRQGRREAFARYIRSLDPYDHPITIHNLPNRWEETFDHMLGRHTFEGPSFQFRNPDAANTALIRQYRSRSADRGRPWVINLDETGKGAKPDGTNWTFLRKQWLWPTLMSGGGGVEYYFNKAGDDWGDQQTEDFRRVQQVWDDNRHGLRFFQKHLPFWEMKPEPSLGKGGLQYVLAKTGEVYAGYAPEGGDSRMKLSPGDYTVRWYNPRTGEFHNSSDELTSEGGWENLGSSPVSGDYAVMVTSSSYAHDPPFWLK